eukprot:COSAG01_NODE_2611_length_7384_cov_7.141386_4_plen_84_part_00
MQGAVPRRLHPGAIQEEGHCSHGPLAFRQAAQIFLTRASHAIDATPAPAAPLHRLDRRRQQATPGGRRRSTGTRMLASHDDSF